MKTVFQKNFMYRLSCRPSCVVYIAEHKTLAGKEDRTYEGEAMGRKMAVVFFEDLDGGLVKRVNSESSGMQQVLLTIAELLQTVGGIAIPPDPDRAAAQTELLLESHYQHLEILRYTCTVEPAAPEVHVFHLDNEVNAEISLARELPQEHRAKMVLARCLQRNDDLQPEETLQGAWATSLANLKARTADLLPPQPPVVVAVPGAPAAPPAAPPAARGRARGRGRGAVPAPVLAGRGRARGRAAGRGP